jgi:hypothetical protein
MLILLRRFLVIAALMFWQGGFTFYAAVVVPTGQQVLGSHFEQGLITRQVTYWLNITGGVALVMLAGELLTGRTPGRPRLRWATLAFLVITLGVLVALHQRLDSLLEWAESTGSGLDREAFRPLHRLYLWVSTAQWAGAVLFAGLTLRAWQREDRLRGKY